jgi:hypothetical protein
VIGSFRDGTLCDGSFCDGSFRDRTFCMSLTLSTGGQLVIDTAGNKRKPDLKVKYTNRL